MAQTPEVASSYAVEIVAAQGPFGAAPYDDPASLLGMPSTDFYDPWGAMSGGATVRRVKLVEPPYNLDAQQAQKLITTLGAGSFVVIRFEQPIADDPSHPYGVDLLVFGNAFFTPSGSVNDRTDLNTLMLTGGRLLEPMKVSVSPGYTGEPGQSPADWQTWAWYRYDHGPYADTAFPTQGYRWHRADSRWSNEWMDFTKPVNPALEGLLSSGDANSLSAADAIDLYDGSGGGTGFDLAESGFATIRYVKVEGLPGFEGGELDAFAGVRPMVLGDSLTIAPGNLTDGARTLRFQWPLQPSATALSLEFKAVSGIARVSANPLPAPAALAPYGPVLNGGAFEATPLLGTTPVTFAADLRLSVGPDYVGNGQDLVVLRLAEQDWEDVAFSFEPMSRAAWVPNVTRPAMFALLEVLPPRLAVALGADGLGDVLITVHFAALPRWTYTLERTEDFVRWDEAATHTPLAAGPTALHDSETAERAFYRVRMERP